MSVLEIIEGISSLQDFQITDELGDNPFLIRYVHDGVDIEIGRYTERAQSWLTLEFLKTKLTEQLKKYENVVNAVLSLRCKGVDVKIRKFRDWTMVHAFGGEIEARSFLHLSSIEEIEEKILEMSPDHVSKWFSFWKGEFSKIQSLKSIEIDTFHKIHIDLEGFGEFSVPYEKREHWSVVLAELIQICQAHEQQSRNLREILESSPLRVRKFCERGMTFVVPASDESRLKGFKREAWDGTPYTIYGIDVEPFRAMFPPDRVYKFNRWEISPIKFTADIDGDDLRFGYSWSRTESWGDHLSPDEWREIPAGSETISGYEELGRFPAIIVN